MEISRITVRPSMHLGDQEGDDQMDSSFEEPIRQVHTEIVYEFLHF